MKHLFFIIASVALLGLFSACTDEDGTVGSLKEIKVSQTYIAFPAEGGRETIDLTANTSWAFDEQYIPEWLTISPSSGNSGEFTVTFTAEAMEDPDSAELEILAGNVTQFINVAIGEEAEPEPVEILEILTNGVVGKTYIVSGWCNSIANTTYGNWYMGDGDGNSLYIYGTMTSGKYDWDSEGIDVGDYVTVKGPLSIYNGTYELVDVVVLSVEKNLISVKTEAETIPKEGGEATVVLEVSGDGMSFSIPEEDKGWLSVSDVVTASDSTIVVFYAQPNTEGDRSSTVTFSTESGGTTYSTEAVINQEGSIIVGTAAEIIAGEDGTRYQMSGYITSVASTTYGNFYLSDYSGEIYVYGTLDAEGNSKNWESLGIDEGDIVTVIGPKTTYNETVELVDVTVTEHFPVTDVTVAEFNAASVASDVYYRLTGTVTEIASTTYGNLYLKDETGSVYVYGLYSGYGGGSQSFADTGVEVGDTIVIVGLRDEYNGTIEANKSFYVETVSKGDGSGDGGDEGGDTPSSGDGTLDNPYSASEAIALVANDSSYDQSVYIKGIVSEVGSLNSNYNELNYYISDDGTTANQLYVYCGYGLNGEKIYSADYLSVGDELVIYGELKAYNGSAEVNYGSKIITINGDDGNGDVDDSDPYVQNVTWENVSSSNSS
ncbi:MAG: hypothetical protein LUD72_01885, partial [Bacteroidales bacterium]|nr:hypothetical protein [Bacteroidales bacterium]